MVAEGNRRAVLVGCNYPDTRFRLHGCINDVLAMKGLITTRFRFPEENVKVLIDEPEMLHVAESDYDRIWPTRTNIMRELEDMMKRAKAGDVLLFHFCGKGTIIPSVEPHQHYGEHEAIVPCDLNLITDMDLSCLIKDLRVGTSFTVVSDSCHSGGLIDQHKEQIGPSKVSAKAIHPHVHYETRTISARSLMSCLKFISSSLSFDNVVGAVTSGAHVLSTVASALNTGSSVMESIASALSGIFKKDVSIRFLSQSEQRDALLDSRNLQTGPEGILLSGCQHNETSADLTGSKLTGEKAHGAFTNALVQVLERNNDSSLTNKDLVVNVRKFLQDQGIEQHPCLYCSDANANEPFLGTPSTKVSPGPDKTRNSDKNKRKPEAEEPSPPTRISVRKKLMKPPSPTPMDDGKMGDDNDE